MGTKGEGSARSVRSLPGLWGTFPHNLPDSKAWWSWHPGHPGSGSGRLAVHGIGCRRGFRCHNSYADEGDGMANDKPFRRMTLRELLTHAEKCSRDLIEHLHATLLPRHTDFRDLSRPVRRRSHYPTMMAILNALNKLEQGGEETQVLAEYLHQNLRDICEHARRDRKNRR
jgi:hypothetical protein